MTRGHHALKKRRYHGNKTATARKQCRGVPTCPVATNTERNDYCITRIMATSQRTTSGTTIFKGKGPDGQGEETLEYAWVKRNFKKWFLEQVVYPGLGEWHKVPL